MDAVGTVKTRSYSYQAATIDPAKAATMSGLDLMRAVMEGKLPRPSIGFTLGFVLVEVEAGRVVFEGAPGDWSYNPLGTVHGGYAATMLDSCLGCVVHTTLPAGTSYTTVELKVNYVRALKPGIVVRAEGKAVHSGGRIATAEGRLIGKDDGKLYAHGSTTCLVMKLGE
ncbi:MAG: PaaI family thioesterase [Alphaproteobacteria bacterium]|nr:PaaI family thioesterase [Alphaproteobacteria bacterium]